MTSRRGRRAGESEFSFMLPGLYAKGTRQRTQLTSFRAALSINLLLPGEEGEGGEGYIRSRRMAGHTKWCRRETMSNLGADAIHRPVLLNHLVV